MLIKKLILKYDKKTQIIGLKDGGIKGQKEKDRDWYLRI